MATGVLAPHKVMTSSQKKKPLRILYKKYASPQAQTDKARQPDVADDAHGELVNEDRDVANVISRLPNAGSLNNLNQIGKETSKFERVHMFLAMSDVVDCAASFVDSSVASSTTGVSQKLRDPSPNRFRSRSQEFQSKFKLAASRHTPERMKDSQNRNVITAFLPKLGTGYCRPGEERDGQQGLNDVNSKPVLQTLIDEHKGNMSQTVKPADVANLQLDNFLARSDSDNSLHDENVYGIGNQLKVNIQHHERTELEEFPRCLSRSSIDADRIDSSHYQHVLNDLSSFTSSATVKTTRSDPASTQASARAQRPSTSGTVGTAQRLRDLYTRTDMNTPSIPPMLSSRRGNSHKISPQQSRSPEQQQWPPRYAMLPSWPSYDDVQTLNSCRDHKGLVARFYTNNPDIKYGRRTRDRAHRVNFRHLEQQDGRQHGKVHVIPSHANTECAMCNLYRQHIPDTMVPPNTPYHDHHGHAQSVISGPSQSYPSTLPSTSGSQRTWASSTNKTRSTTSSLGNSKRITRSSHEAKRRGFPALNNRRKYDTASTPGGLTSDLISKSTPMPFLDRLPTSKTMPHRGKGVSYTWDVHKSYVNAHA